LDNTYAVGQCWTYNTLPGFEHSRIIIGAIDEIPDIGEIICITLTNAPLPKPDGSAPDMADIPFVPFARDAIDQSVLQQEDDAELPMEFSDLHDNWMEETEGEEFLPIPVPLFLDMLAAGSRG
jgi:hypothetical protein